MFDLILALRNLFRHRMRSASALAAVVFGVVALMVSGGFIEWIYSAMRESVIQSRFGHIQVVRPGYFRDGAADPFAFLLSADAPEFATLQATPGVKLVTPRLAFSGLLSHGDVTLSFLGEGVQPDTEPRVSQQLTILTGQELSAEDHKGIIVGEGLAANAGLSLGDPIVLLVQTASGGVNAVEGKVRGIFYTSTKAYDDVSLRVPIELARKLLRVSGAHNWVVLLDRTEDTAAVLNRLREQFPAADHRLEFVPWTALADFYNKTVALFSRQMNVVKLIIALIIVFSISNTLSMSVLERTGEIGTLMALGNRRRRIIKLFVTEGLLLGVVGGSAGILIGLLVAQLISVVGIPMPPPPGMNRGFTGAILITVPLLTQAWLMAVVTAVLASLHPAWKASRLVIVEALRHNR
jgi:putative ABC transport system permease protein